jgi:hypothetical protein
MEQRIAENRCHARAVSSDPTDIVANRALSVKPQRMLLQTGE